jgi:hypothetical protein
LSKEDEASKLLVELKIKNSFYARTLSKAQLLTMLSLPIIIGVAISSSIAPVTNLFIQTPFVIALIICVLFIFHYEKKAR